MAMLVETNWYEPVNSLSQLSSPDLGGRPAAGLPGAPHPGADHLTLAAPTVGSGGPGAAHPGQLQADVLAACTRPDLVPGFTDWLRDVVRRLDDPAR